MVATTVDGKIAESREPVWAQSGWRVWHLFRCQKPSSAKSHATAAAGEHAPTRSAACLLPHCAYRSTQAAECTLVPAAAVVARAASCPKEAAGWSTAYTPAKDACTGGGPADRARRRHRAGLVDCGCAKPLQRLPAHKPAMRSSHGEGLQQARACLGATWVLYGGSSTPARLSWA